MGMRSPRLTCGTRRLALCSNAHHPCKPGEPEWIGGRCCGPQSQCGIHDRTILHVMETRVCSARPHLLRGGTIMAAC